MYLKPEAYIKIREETLKELHKQYPGQFIKGKPWDHIALFPAKHERVGYLKLYLDNDGVTFVIQYVSQRHISCPHDYTLEKAANYIKCSVMELLEDLFKDNMLLGVDRDLSFSLAIPHCSPSDRKDYMEPGVDYFVWSGHIPIYKEIEDDTGDGE